MMRSRKQLFKQCVVLASASTMLLAATALEPPKIADESAGGGLKTDPELDVLLERAEQFANNKRYDLASELWQKVIDDSNDAVMTKAEWVEESLKHQYKTYKPVQDEIERTLSTLPEEALKVYRLRADGEAAAVLAAARNQDQYEIALGTVVRRYFLSSQGDDAAYELAGLHLDRFEFLPALRLVNKVLQQYPEPSVSKADMYRRVAVAHRYSGNKEAADEAMEALTAHADSEIAPELIAWMKSGPSAEVSAVAAAGDGNREWLMPLGNAERTGVSPAPAMEDARKLGLGVKWKQGFVVTLPEELEGIIRQKEDLEESVPDLLDAWEVTDWMPTGRMILRGGLLYFKKDDRLVCLNTEDGSVQWMGYRNGFAMDAVSKQLRQFGNRGFRSNTPTTKKAAGPLEPETLQSFQDHVSQAMVFADNKIIALEGRPLDLTAVESDDGNARFAWSRGSPTRKRENWMVAYHAQNGKLKWHRTAGDRGTENEATACFVGDPVPYGSLIYCSVLDKNSLWLYAMDARTGTTIWKKYLCDEEPGAVSRFSGVALALSGGEVYVSSGAGLAFGLDAISGVLRWAVRYPRSVDPKVGNSYYYTQARKLHGWDQDVVIPHGNEVLVLASDFDQLLALNRNNGSLMWESPRAPSSSDGEASYCLGVSNGKVIVAGRKAVRAYKIDGGRMLWTRPVETFARGLLAADAIYLPGKSELIVVDPETGKIVDTIDAETVDDQPLGNLFSDGENLYAIGLRRVVCFQPKVKVEQP